MHATVPRGAPHNTAELKPQFKQTARLHLLYGRWGKGGGQEASFVKKKNSSHVEIIPFTLHVSASVALLCLDMPWQTSDTDVYLQLQCDSPCLAIRH